ncbi:three-helix bundle dimerization domain-containing protein [Pseudonocardia sp. GCM10023141]|uniref:three-helix bundle dimerization domain-containing protein n=1 Tax=Pseudonocardia sp. GCM10023141 TaxID=3252653 RepID=UPI00360DB883
MTLHVAIADREPMPPHPDPAVTSAIARLTTEFAGRFRHALITRTVVGARGELAGSPVPALPELVERLARERLRQAANPGGMPR